MAEIWTVDAELGEMTFRPVPRMLTPDEWVDLMAKAAERAEETMRQNLAADLFSDD